MLDRDDRANEVDDEEQNDAGDVEPEERRNLLERPFALTLASVSRYFPLELSIISQSILFGADFDLEVLCIVVGWLALGWLLGYNEQTTNNEIFVLVLYGDF